MDKLDVYTDFEFYAKINNDLLVKYKLDEKHSKITKYRSNVLTYIAFEEIDNKEIPTAAKKLCFEVFNNTIGEVKYVLRHINWSILLMPINKCHRKPFHNLVWTREHPDTMPDLWGYEKAKLVEYVSFKFVDIDSNIKDTNEIKLLAECL